MKRRQPGDQIEMREVWGGRTWEVRCGFVIEDSEELIAIYTPPSAPAVIAVGPDGKRLRLPPPEWEMREAAVPEDRQFVAVHAWGEDHSLLLIYDNTWEMLCWYVNLESDARRTESGIEYEEHILDVVVAPDMSSWRWKDEGELAEAVGLGLYSANQASTFRTEGERARDWLLARRPPYDRRWENWRPPPGWGELRAPVP